jgi:hypothetical protein
VTEKERIRQEEIFRQEIRTELEKKGVSGKGLWKFVNSAFGLWLLSSVVIAGFTFLYSAWDKNEQEKRSQRSERRRIETEVQARINQARNLQSGASNEQFWVALLLLQQPMHHEFSIATMPEYEKSSLLALLYRLQDLVPQASRQKLSSAQQRARILSDLFVSKVGSIDRGAVAPTGGR